MFVYSLNSCGGRDTRCCGAFGPATAHNVEGHHSHQRPTGVWKFSQKQEHGNLEWGKHCIQQCNMLSWTQINSFLTWLLLFPAEYESIIQASHYYDWKPSFWVNFCWSKLKIWLLFNPSCWRACRIPLYLSIIDNPVSLPLFMLLLVLFLFLMLGKRCSKHYTLWQHSRKHCGKPLLKGDGGKTFSFHLC